MQYVARAFFHAGITAPAVAAGRNVAGENLLQQPYLGGGSALLDTEDGAAPQIIGPAPKGTTVVHIQIPAGMAACVEINAPHVPARDASANRSPVYTGNVWLDCAAGWSVSIVDGT